jgi:hypothetical protein
VLIRKRQELAQVQERLAAGDVSLGIARELRRQQTLLERQIAELLAQM